MKSLRLGPWLLVPWYELANEGRRVELDEPADAARILRRAIAACGPISLQAFVRELDGGALLDVYEGELIERIAVLIARRRVQLVYIETLPICTAPVEVVEYTPEPAPLEEIIDEVEMVDWSTELETDDPVWFEVASEVEEPVQFEVASEFEEPLQFEVASEVEESSPPTPD